MGRADGDESAFGPLGSSAYDTCAKVNPPLRARADMEAMVAGLRDGVIDVIATDHAPHNSVEKLCTFQEAAMGISVLETALGSLMSLTHSGEVPLRVIVDKLTNAPAKFLGRSDIGTLQDGALADVTIFDTAAEWVVESDKFVSRGKNSPYHGSTLSGQVVTTIVGGKIAFAVNSTEMNKG